MPLPLGDWRRRVSCAAAAAGPTPTPAASLALAQRRRRAAAPAARVGDALPAPPQQQPEQRRRRQVLRDDVQLSGGHPAQAVAQPATHGPAAALSGAAPPAPSVAAAAAALGIRGGGKATTKTTGGSLAGQQQRQDANPTFACPAALLVSPAELARRADVLRRLLPVDPARVARAAAARPALLLLAPPPVPPPASSLGPTSSDGTEARASELAVTLAVARRVCASAAALGLPSARRLSFAVSAAAEAAQREAASDESAAAAAAAAAAARLSAALVAAVPDAEMRFRLAAAEPALVARSLDALLDLLPSPPLPPPPPPPAPLGGAGGGGDNEDDTAANEAHRRRCAAAMRAALVRCPRLVGAKRARLAETVAALEEATGARGPALTALLLLAPPLPAVSSLPAAQTRRGRRRAEGLVTDTLAEEEEDDEGGGEGEFAEGGDGSEDDDEDEDDDKGNDDEQEEQSDAAPSSPSVAAAAAAAAQAAAATAASRGRPPPYSASDAARLLALPPARLRAAAEDVRAALGLGARGLSARLRRDPTVLLAPRGTDNARLVVDALARRLRAPRDEAAALALDAPPALLMRAPGAAVAVLDAVGGAFGLSPRELVQVAAFDPSLLARSPAPLQARLRRLTDAVYLPSVAERRARKRRESPPGAAVAAGASSSSSSSSRGRSRSSSRAARSATDNEWDLRSNERCDGEDDDWGPPPATTAWAVQLQALTRGKPQNAARLATAALAGERVDRLLFLRSGAGGKGAAGRVRLKDVLGASPRAFSEAYPAYEAWRKGGGDKGGRGRKGGGGKEGGGEGGGSPSPPVVQQQQQQQQQQQHQQQQQQQQPQQQQQQQRRARSKSRTRSRSRPRGGAAAQRPLPPRLTLPLWPPMPPAPLASPPPVSLDASDAA